ncbi:MAG: hypothetical protein WBQ14_05990 [Gaiellaceae bacterium]
MLLSPLEHLGLPQLLVYVLRGVKLGALDRRDPGHFGAITPPELEGRIRERAAELGEDEARRALDS